MTVDCVVGTTTSWCGDCQRLLGTEVPSRELAIKSDPKTYCRDKAFAFLLLPPDRNLISKSKSAS